MKDKRKLFGLALAVFAGLSFWWLSSQDEDMIDMSADAPRLPDSYFKNMSIVSHDDSGEPVSRLEAARATHYPDDPKVYLEDLRSRGLDSDDAWVLRAKRGEFHPDEDILHASGDVRLLSEGSAPGAVPVILRTDRLKFDTQAELATTDAPVEITQGASRVRGEGLYADLGNDYVEIPARVEARYEK